MEKRLKKKRVLLLDMYGVIIEDAPKDYTEISFECLREDGCLELPVTVETACWTAARKAPELEGFHFHTLRHIRTLLISLRFSLMLSYPKTTDWIFPIGCLA